MGDIIKNNEGYLKIGLPRNAGYVYASLHAAYFS